MLYWKCTHAQLRSPHAHDNMGTVPGISQWKPFQEYPHDVLSWVHCFISSLSLGCSVHKFSRTLALLGSLAGNKVSVFTPKITSSYFIYYRQTVNAKTLNISFFNYMLIKYTSVLFVTMLFFLKRFQLKFVLLFNVFFTHANVTWI